MSRGIASNSRIIVDSTIRYLAEEFDRQLGVRAINSDIDFRMDFGRRLTLNKAENTC